MKKTYIIPVVESLDCLAEELIAASPQLSTQAADQQAEVLTKEDSWNIWE